MACSRTPKRRLRPALAGLEVALALEVASGCSRRGRRTPPNSSGSGSSASADVAGDACRVASSSLAPRPRSAAPASQPPGRRRPMRRCELGGQRPGDRARRRRSVRATAPRAPRRCGTASRNERQRVVGDVEGLVRDPAVGLLGEAHLVLAERRAVGLLRCPACAASRSRCASRTAISTAAVALARAS